MARDVPNDAPSAGRQRRDRDRSIAWARLAPVLRQIGIGYFAVAVFFASFIVLGRPEYGLDFTQRLILSLVAVCPLIVPFAGRWLRGMQISGLRVGLTTVEVTLERASVTIPPLFPPGLEVAIAGDIHDSTSAALAKVLPALAASLTGQQARAVALNLAPEGQRVPYWWSTRLYLVAAILADSTKIQTIYFVDGGEWRHYAGRVSTIELRDRLAAEYSDLRTHWDYCREHTKSIKELIDLWGMATFDDGQKTEEEFKTRLGAEGLKQILGEALDTHAVERSDKRESELVHALVTSKTRFVPLTTGGQLDHVVDAQALARRWSVLSTGRGLA